MVDWFRRLLRRREIHCKAQVMYSALDDKGRFLVLLHVKKGDLYRLTGLNRLEKPVSVSFDTGQPNLSILGES